MLHVLLVVAVCLFMAAIFVGLAREMRLTFTGRNGLPDRFSEEDWGELDEMRHDWSEPGTTKG
jgi:hypothetical protein